MKNQAHHPAKGDLLLSEPFLADTNFERSVVLICEHTDEGALGFVLNKPSQLTLADVVEEAAGFEPLVYTGGPVQQDTLHFVHRSSALREGSDDLGGALYWGGDFRAAPQFDQHPATILGGHTILRRLFRLGSGAISG